MPSNVMSSVENTCIRRPIATLKYFIDYILTSHFQ